MAFTKDEIKDIYKKRAKNFDITSKLYRLIGFNDIYFRKKVVSKANISNGCTVVDIGCGTGLNFEYILHYIGNEGKIIGLDISDDMLEIARTKIKKNHWNNIEVYCKEALDFNYTNVDAIISTLAFTLIPEYQQLLCKISKELPKNKKFVILDLKQPKKVPLWLIKILVKFAKPFGVTLDLTKRKPYEDAKKYFNEVKITEYFFGIVYILEASNV